MARLHVAYRDGVWRVLGRQVEQRYLYALHLLTNASGTKTNPENADLQAMVLKSDSDAPEVVLKALDFISSLEEAPSCKRTATASLLSSCQDLGRLSNELQQRNSRVALEDVQNLFAARLALCELATAGVLAPEECQAVEAVVDRPKASKPGRRCFGSGCTKSGWSRKGHRGSGADLIDKHELTKCLSALESRQQSWTSYSNAQRNAILVCQAARLEIEKGD